MANTYSALKRMRQADRRTEFNRKSKSRLRHAIREMRKVITGKDAKAASDLLPKIFSVIDRSAKNGIIKKNTAARYKSKLHGRVKALAAYRPSGFLQPSRIQHPRAIRPEQNHPPWACERRVPGECHFGIVRHSCQPGHQRACIEPRQRHRREIRCSYFQNRNRSAARQRRYERQALTPGFGSRRARPPCPAAKRNSVASSDNFQVRERSRSREDIPKRHAIVVDPRFDIDAIPERSILHVFGEQRVVSWTGTCLRSDQPVLLAEQGLDVSARSSPR